MSETVEARVIAVCLGDSHEFTLKLGSTSRSGESRLVDLLMRAFEEKRLVRLALVDPQMSLLEE